MQYGEFIKRVSEQGGPADTEHARHATTVVLEVLGQRLAGAEPSNLAAQLPEELKEPLSSHTGQAESFDVDEFFRRVADREGRGCSPEQAREHAQAVVGTMASFVSEGELNDVRSQLPAGYEILLKA